MVQGRIKFQREYFFLLLSNKKFLDCVCVCVCETINTYILEMLYLRTKGQNNVTRAQDNSPLNAGSRP